MTSRALTSAGLMLVALAPPFAAAGQDAGAEGEVQVVGVLIDRETGDPVPGARIVFSRVGDDGEPLFTGFANRDGRFTTTPLPVGGYVIEVEALSYASISHFEIFPQRAVVDLRILMAGVDYALDPLVVSVRRQTRLERTGFPNRQQRGIGHFIGLAEIQARQPREVSDLFWDVPGARVTPDLGIGRGAAVLLRGGCVPQVVMDGALMSGPVSLDQVLRPDDLEAIEVYHGATAPIQYQSSSNCGTIMVWTRSPPEPTGETFSLTKLFVVVGFATLAVVSTN